MEKKLGRLLLGLLFLAMFTCLPQKAEAININLENPYPHNMFAAIVYYEDAAGKWVTRGWYKVASYTTRELNFSSSTKRNSVYIYAFTSEASWGGSQEPIKRTVIKESFKYYDGETCPPGNNRRKVQFDRWYAENDGVVYWRP